jgi:hypothetical protein
LAPSDRDASSDGFITRDHKAVLPKRGFRHD